MYSVCTVGGNKYRDKEDERTGADVPRPPLHSVVAYPDLYVVKVNSLERLYIAAKMRAFCSICDDVRPMIGV